MPRATYEIGPQNRTDLPTRFQSALRSLLRATIYISIGQRAALMIGLQVRFPRKEEKKFSDGFPSLAVN